MKVTYGQIEDIATNLENYSTSMKDVLDEVTTYFGKIGNEGIFAGEAAESVKGEFARLSQKFPEFYETIMKCATHLRTVVSNYKTVDTAINGEQ